MLYRVLNGFAGADARKRITDKQGPTVVHQKPGPLQTIFDLPPYEASTLFTRFETYVKLKLYIIMNTGFWIVIKTLQLFV